MYHDKIEALEKKIHVPIEKEKELKELTTMKVGGPAEYFVMPTKKEDMKTILIDCIEYSVPFYIMGNGSNLLVADDGVLGLIIHTGKLDTLSVNEAEKTITSGAGVSLGELAMKAYDYGLTGLEFASGIPGSVGGGVFMNAGAYGGSMSDVFVEGTVLSRHMQLETWSQEDMNFDYRTSQLKKTYSYLIDATFKLESGDKPEIMATMKELNKRRKDKQPLEYPSSGSTFKRPEGHFAGKLIMEADFAGFSIGDAAVSDKHCGFVINKGKATSKDIIKVMNEVKETILEKNQIALEPEMEFVGQFTKEEREMIRFLRGQ